MTTIFSPSCKAHIVLGINLARPYRNPNLTRAHREMATPRNMRRNPAAVKRGKRRARTQNTVIHLVTAVARHLHRRENTKAPQKYPKTQPIHHTRNQNSKRLQRIHRVIPSIENTLLHRAELLRVPSRRKTCTRKS